MRGVDELGTDGSGTGQAVKLIWPHRLEDAAYDLPLLHLRGDPEGPWDREAVALFLEEPEREGMEGADQQLRVAGLAERRDPLLHLARRLLGESQDQDVLGVDAAEPEQVEIPGGDDTCLSGARAGQHHQLTLQALASFGLGRVEVRRRVDRHVLRRRPRAPSLRSLSPASRKRISTTAVSPILWLRPSMMVCRWRWSWCPIAGLWVSTVNRPRKKLVGDVCAATISPTTAGQADRIWTKRARVFRPRRARVGTSRSESATGPVSSPRLGERRSGLKSSTGRSPGSCGLSRRVVNPQPRPGARRRRGACARAPRSRAGSSRPRRR